MCKMIGLLYVGIDSGGTKQAKGRQVWHAYFLEQHFLEAAGAVVYIG